jgi:RNA polymerase sigma-70 factor (ECF subfamily)
MKRMAETDALAVQQAQAGDRDAFRALVERHSRSIFRLAFRMTGNEHDAEEVVQETFLRAYRRLDKFESRANFGTWLYRIGVNCSLDLMRARQRHEANRDAPAPAADEHAPGPVEQVDSEAPSQERVVWSGQLGERIREALGTLSDIERAAFLLRHMEGLSIEEIGAALGLRESATKNSIFRAVQKIRRALEPALAARAGS